jgi:hypothetical protein
LREKSNLSVYTTIVTIGIYVKKVYLLPQIIEHKKKTMTYAVWKCRSWLGTDSNVEMQVLAWDRHSNVAGLNRSMAPKSLLIIGSPIVIDIYTNNKNICTRHSLPRTHTMTNNINMDNTIQTCLLLRFRRIYYAFLQ